MQSLLASTEQEMGDSTKPSRNSSACPLRRGSCIIFIVKHYVPSTDSCVCAVCGIKLAEDSCLQPPPDASASLSFSSLFSLSSSSIGGLKDVTQTP